jgi:hypothetical protein
MLLYHCQITDCCNRNSSHKAHIITKIQFGNSNEGKFATEVSDVSDYVEEFCRAKQADNDIIAEYAKGH